MTLPDSLKRIRNAFAVLAVAALGASLCLAYSANFWLAILDYWKVWMMIASGVGGIGCCIGATVSHMIMLESLRSN